jgi:hypothetical protein
MLHVFDPAHAGWPALVALSTACALEVAGYYLPVVDNLLDTVATPLATLAGALAAGVALVGSDALGDLPGVVQWALPLLAGAGVAGTVQMGTVATRAASTTATAGIANPIIATVENAGSVALSIAAILVPIVAGVTVLCLASALAIVAVRIARRRRARISWQREGARLRAAA